MNKRQVRLTVLVKKCFAFRELHKENETILRTAVLINEEDMIDGKNPPQYEGFETGYADIPVGFFRIEEISNGDGVPDAPESTVSTEGQNISHMITKALGQLDSDHDGHWTADGIPRLDVLVNLVGEKVTRSEVEFAEPGFDRESNRI